MTDQRARAERLLTDLIQLVATDGGYFSDTEKARSVAISALADERRRVLMEVGDECSMRAYAIGINEPLHTNHMQQFLEWIRAQAHAGQEG